MGNFMKRKTLIGSALMFSLLGVMNISAAFADFQRIGNRSFCEISTLHDQKKSAVAADFFCFRFLW